MYPARTRSELPECNMSASEKTSPGLVGLKLAPTGPLDEGGVIEGRTREAVAISESLLKYVGPDGRCGTGDRMKDFVQYLKR